MGQAARLVTVRASRREIGTDPELEADARIGQRSQCAQGVNTVCRLREISGRTERGNFVRGECSVIKISIHLCGAEPERQTSRRCVTVQTSQPAWIMSNLLAH